MALFQLLPRRKADRRDTVAVVGIGDVSSSAAVSAPATDPWLTWFDPDGGPQASVFGWLDWPVLLGDFAGRDKELQELLLWARTGRGVRVRWLVGPGGAGKSRLAAEAARTLRDQGWQAGFVRTDQGMIVPISADGAFLVIENPDEQAVNFDRLLADLAALDSVPDQPVRILVVDRAGPGDRLPAANPYARTVFDPPLQILPELPEAEAHQVFRSAQRRVPQDGDGRPEAAAAPVPRLRFLDWYRQHPSNRMPLGVLAAAVAGARAPARPLDDLTGAGALLACVERERGRLAAVGVRHGLEPEALPRLTAFAAVEGDLDHTGLRRWAEPALRVGLPPRPEIVERLRRTEVLVDGVLPAPGPDVCAAGLVVTTLAQAPDLAPEWLWAALGNGIAPALVRLARLADDAEERLGLTRPRLAGWLSAMVVGRPERCRRLDQHLGDRWPAAFTSVAVSVFSTLALDTGAEEAERAGFYTRLSDALTRQGDAEGALDAAARSLALWRGLAERSPDTHAAGFGDICDRKARALAGTGDWAGAAAMATDALRVRRQLAARRRSHAGSYAETLGLNALCRTMTGAAAEGAALAETAVALARCVPDEDTDAARFRLGVVLDVQSRVYRLGGDHARADAVLEESDALWHLLTRDAPGRFVRPPPELPL